MEEMYGVCNKDTTAYQNGIRVIPTYENNKGAIPTYENTKGVTNPYINYGIEETYEMLNQNKTISDNVYEDCVLKTSGQDDLYETFDRFDQDVLQSQEVTVQPNDNNEESTEGTTIDGSAEGKIQKKEKAKQKLNKMDRCAVPLMLTLCVVASLAIIGIGVSYNILITDNSKKIEMEKYELTKAINKLVAKERLHTQESKDMMEDIKQLKRLLTDSILKQDKINMEVNRTIENQSKILNEKGLMDRLFPIGAVYITYVNMTPPMQEEYGVSWEQLPEGYALMTANSRNSGQRSGSHRLDTGYTNGHTLSVDEMPNHYHNVHGQYYVYMDDPNTGEYKVLTQRRSGSTWKSTTYTSGSNSAHQHQLNIMNHKVMVWKRIA